jgi:hypothetical protein
MDTKMDDIVWSVHFPTEDDSASVMGDSWDVWGEAAGGDSTVRWHGKRDFPTLIEAIQFAQINSVDINDCCVVTTWVDWSVQIVEYYKGKEVLGDWMKARLNA